MSDFLDSKINVPCPECGRRLHVTLRDIQNGRTVICSGGHQVTLKQQGRGIQQVDKALNDLNRSIKQLNQKLRRR